MAEANAVSLPGSSGLRESGSPSVQTAYTMSSLPKSDIESTEEEGSSFLKGWRLQVLNLSLCLGLFLSLLETTIMSTSLLAITDDLQDQQNSTWIVTAYLLTYTGFIIPLTKLSDIYGRRPVLVASTLVFIAASAGAGGSNNMAELCICRAIQGIGGGGLFGLTFIVVPDMVPRSLFNRYSVIVSSAFAMGNLFGPVFGGVINNHGSWRWIFWLNIPGGVISLTLLLISMPKHFPFQNRPVNERPTYNLSSLARIDWIGVILVLAATCLLVAALEVGGNQYAWNSTIPLVLLIVSILCWVLLIPWEWYQSTRQTKQEPVLPWRILTNRHVMGVLLNALCFGAAFFAVVINLPLRFQLVDGQTPLDAAYRLLAVTLVTPIGSVLSGILSQKLKVPALYLLLGAGVLQTAGLALYAGIDAGETVQKPSMYVFEVIIGLGLGATLNTALLGVPILCDSRDVSSALGFIGQFRALGGSIGIAACANLMNRALNDNIADLVRAGLLGSEDLSLLQNPTSALGKVGRKVGMALAGAYADAFRQEMWLVTGFCAACIVFALLLVEKSPRSV